MKLKNKSLYKKKFKTGLGDKGETWNVNCHTAYHHLRSYKDLQFTPFFVFKRMEEVNTVTVYCQCYISTLLSIPNLLSSSKRGSYIYCTLHYDCFTLVF
jgi:hypothetical protein